MNRYVLVGSNGGADKEPAWVANVAAMAELLKVAFADHADLDTLRHNIAAILVMADARVNYVTDRIDDYRLTGGPFPGRLPVTMLIARFHQEQAAAAQRWARWAQAQVESWGGVTTQTGARVPS